MDKQALRGYRWHRQELDMLDELMQRVEARIEQVTPKEVSDMPSGKSTAGDRVGGGVAHLCELREMYNRMWDVLIDEAVEFERGLERLSATERVLMRLRYEKGLSWGEVAKEMGYEWAQIHRIHGKALAKMIHNDIDLRGMMVP